MKNGAKKLDAADVAILGGGLAGLSLALQVRRRCPQAQIVVLEKNRRPAPEAAFKVGESTVEVAAYYFGKVLKLEDHIREHQLPKLGLRFFWGAGDNRSIEQRLELGGRRFPPAPSYQLDRGRFENHLGEACCDEGVQLLDGAEVDDFTVRGGWLGRRHDVRYRRNGESRTLQARWLVDASGRAALLKRRLGLAKPSPHQANATWFRVDARLAIDEWATEPAWREGFESDAERWYSTNHLMGPGYWVWLIPLASGATSVGIVADEKLHPLNTFNSLEKSLAWLDQHEPQCAEKIREHQDRILDFGAVKHYSMECTQAFSMNRWGFTGESGFFLDPFYSPGSDFIAFANMFLTDLIERDLGGKSFGFRAFLYDKIFKKFFYGTSHVYEHQYELFGHHQVMPIKVLWDYMTYWSLLGFIFLQGRTCETLMYPRHMFKLTKLGRMNEFMQGYLRAWSRQVPSREVGGMIDISSMPLIRRMNERLLDDLTTAQYNARFAENLRQVETLFWEIIDFVKLDTRVPFRRVSHRDAIQQGFAHAFDVVSSRPQPTVELSEAR